VTPGLSRNKALVVMFVILSLFLLVYYNSQSTALEEHLQDPGVGVGAGGESLPSSRDEKKRDEATNTATSKQDKDNGLIDTVERIVAETRKALDFEETVPEST